MTESIYAAKPWLPLLSEAQRVSVHPAATLVHAFRESVARAPDHPALAYFDGCLTYRETDALSDSVAGHLAVRGLERGDRVAIMLQNSPQFVLALLGAWKAGATVVPLNPMYKSGEVGHVLKDAEVTALICSDRAWEAYLRDTAAAAPAVRIAVTACELDFQTKNDERVLNFERLPAADDAAFPDGELRTGDIGFMDREGWLYVVDRKKDMINASGFKVWPREVEDVLYTHRAVREAAVVGVPDAYRGETVRAYVSLRPGSRVEPDELAAYCKERLAAYKYPREVEILTELPKTASGKILRRELRSPR
ncbi:AMP-binding protein [Streptomyces brevispora]|uniref:AMP-binding enzyme n=1 Tax=Streptomyces brevispora TaxID=887462 RepID=A0A561URW5_9ACTN|nr:AMP-binding protein [Streptomyces brevispora]TWG02110.1 AMP-binding enzyme [Streptomyces brevispora]WSC16707.1 AMP-binding protein [Streptomyces brevispora]